MGSTSNAMPFLFLIRFNFIKHAVFEFYLFQSLFMVFNVTFAFTIVFNLLSHKWERQSVTIFWTLNISCWNKSSVFYDSNLESVGKKMNLLNDKKVKKKCLEAEFYLLQNWPEILPCSKNSWNNLLFFELEETKSWSNGLVVIVLDS